jgi:UDP-2,3-diacylglucosamine pyrophosphatase LpxH
MLVFISDLHLSDGTSATINLKQSILERFLSDVARYSRKYKSNSIKIILLGDIFDFLRTDYWMKVPIDERPWGGIENLETIGKHLETIFDRIVKNNQEYFDLFKKTMRLKYGFWSNPEIHFIPGNHDKYINYYPQLREKVRKSLNIVGKKDEKFPLEMFDKETSTFALHGHIYDDLNYTENNNGNNPLGITIGDLVATELVVKIQYYIREELKKQMNNQDELEAIMKRVFGIVYVRPMSAIAEWLDFETNRDNQLFELSSKVFNQVSREFKDLYYIKRILNDTKDKRFSFNNARKLNTAMFLIRKANISTFKHGVAFYERTLKNSLDIGSDISYVIDYCNNHRDTKFFVQGHTHRPAQIPIHQDSNPKHNQTYLNTGTWQTLFQYNKPTEKFIRLNNITYTMIFTPDEAKTTAPSFEVWNGIY